MAAPGCPGQPAAGVLPRLWAREECGAADPGWPYSFIAALEPGRSSWTAVLDAGRLHPDDNETAVAALQISDVVTRLQESGQWKEGDPDILLIFDSGYELARLAFLLADLPVVVLGRMRSDKVLCFPAPPPGRTGRPPRHGASSVSPTSRVGAPRRPPPTPPPTGTVPPPRRNRIGCTRGLPTVAPGPSIRDYRRSWRARSSG
ncbi:transposase [Rhodococcus sp. NPDC056960]|uniref:transposase n=1 Tax=Rhodococcus TaxID=1827 RepID=UPI0036421651